VLIQESLKKLMNVGTMIIVAHRLSTIQHADKIIVMQKGRIIEEGNHQELLKQRGHYYNLYQLQYEAETKGKRLRSLSNSEDY
jgi:ATP-binding cassette subfamily B protein